MTPQEAAELVITCTATGVSDLPLWEYLPGMQVIDAVDPTRLGPGRITEVLHTDFGVNLVITTRTAERLILAACVRPDFTDQLTVQALYLLVRRAWPGHLLSRLDGPDGSTQLLVFADDGDGYCDLEVFASECGPAYAVFARALAKAPIRS